MILKFLRLFKIIRVSIKYGLDEIAISGLQVPRTAKLIDTLIFWRDLSSPRGLRLRLALEEGRIALHGWVYDIESGSIAAFDGATRQFVPLAANPRVCAIPLRQPTAA